MFLKETGKLGEGDAAGSLGDLQREMSEDLSDRRTNRSCMIRSINVDRYVGHGTVEYLRFAVLMISGTQYCYERAPTKYKAIEKLPLFFLRSTEGSSKNFEWPGPVIRACVYLYPVDKRLHEEQLATSMPESARYIFNTR